MRRLLAAVALAWMMPCAAVVTSAADVLDAYRKLDAYCDKGRHSHDRGFAFERCARRDGNFKETILPDDGQSRVIRWSDGATMYTEQDHAQALRRNAYFEIPPEVTYSVPREEVFLSFVLERLLPDAGKGTAPVVMLKSFAPLQTGMDDRYVVFERQERYSVLSGHSSAVTRHTLWVSREDGLIRRYEAVTPGFPAKSVSLEHVDVNRSLSREDLWHDASISARYSPLHHPIMFIVAATVVAFVIGLVAWPALALAVGADRLVRIRPRLWQGYWIVCALIVAGLVALGIALSGPRDGFLGFIITLAMAWYALLAMAIGGVFMLTSRFAIPVLQLIGRVKRTT